MTIQRYYYSGDELSTDEDGSWARWEDVEKIIKERDELRLRLLSAAGDDLCRLTPEEIKAYTSGAVQIPPKEEFLPSCERFHAQISSEAGELKGCLTLAQLIAENERQRRQIEDLTLPKGPINDNSTNQQAYAWTQLHTALTHEGLYSFIPFPLIGTAIDHCKQFIRELGKRSELLKKVEKAAKADEKDLAEMRDGTKLTRSGVVQALAFAQEEIKELKERLRNSTEMTLDKDGN